jgi:hypothetical protein
MRYMLNSVCARVCVSMNLARQTCGFGCKIHHVQLGIQHDGCTGLRYVACLQCVCSQLAVAAHGSCRSLVLRCKQLFGARCRYSLQAQPWVNILLAVACIVRRLWWPWPFLSTACASNVAGVTRRLHAVRTAQTGCARAMAATCKHTPKASHASSHTHEKHVPAVQGIPLAAVPSIHMKTYQVRTAVSAPPSQPQAPRTALTFTAVPPDRFNTANALLVPAPSFSVRLTAPSLSCR